MSKFNVGDKVGMLNGATGIVVEKIKDKFRVLVDGKGYSFIEESHRLCHVTEPSVQERIEKLEQELAGLKRELGKQNKRKIRPEYGDTFWYIDTVGCICHAIWEISETDNAIWNQGNGYPTEAEAIAEQKRRKIHQELKDFAKLNNEHEPDWNDRAKLKYSLRGDFHNNKVEVNSIFDWKTPNDVCFTSNKTAEQAIAHIGAERLLRDYFGVGVEE